MRKLDRRRRANFEFVREGQFQKEAEVARIRVSTEAYASDFKSAFAMLVSEPNRGWILVCVWTACFMRLCQSLAQKPLFNQF